MGEICPRSDPDIAHMRYYLGPLKLKYGPHLMRSRGQNLRKPYYFEVNSLSKPWFFSTPVHMHGGLICIVFCLSVCLSVTPSCYELKSFSCLSIVWLVAHLYVILQVGSLQRQVAFLYSSHWKLVFSKHLGSDYQQIRNDYYPWIFIILFYFWLDLIAQ